MNDLLVKIAELKPATLFDKHTGEMTNLLDLIEKNVKSLVFDVEEKKDREEIKSLAHKVARSKTALEELGKNQVSDMNAKVKAINVVRGEMKTRLDALKNEVRAPLTEFEGREEKRISELQSRVSVIRSLGDITEGFTLEELEDRLLKAKGIELVGFEEFEPSALSAKEGVVTLLNDAITTTKKRKAESDELEALRAEKAKRDEDDRIKEIERRAEAKVLNDIADQKKADQKKIDDQKAEIERGKERERLAEKRRKEDEAFAEGKAKRDAEKAVNDERERVAEQKRVDDHDEKVRSENKKHMAGVNNLAMKSLFDATGITESEAKEIIIAIALGKVAGVKIQY